MNRAEALLASDSFDVEERLSSIPFISQFDDDECRRAMIWLMTDSDIAVCDAAGEHLVLRNDLKAAEVLFIGIAVSHEQQRAWTLRAISNAWKAGKFELEPLTDAILSEGDFLTRQEVHDVLQWLGLDGPK